MVHCKYEIVKEQLPLCGVKKIKGKKDFVFFAGGGKRIRTADHLVANQALSQLSYTPKITISKSEIRNLFVCFEIRYSNFELVFLGGPR